VLQTLYYKTSADMTHGQTLSHQMVTTTV